MKHLRTFSVIALLALLALASAGIVSADAPGDFTLISPPDGITVTDPAAFTEIQWTESEEAELYRFGLDLVNGDDSHLFNLDSDDIACVDGICTLTVTDDIRALLVEGQYEWRVSAFGDDEPDDDERTIASNAPFTFTVNLPDPIGAFNLLTPPNMALVTDPTAVTQIQWEQASGADSFNFVLTRTTDSTTVLDLTFGTEICDGSVCTIPVSPEVQALLTEGDYSWDVTASNSDNSSTSGNGPWTFTVNLPDPIGAFNLLTPPNEAIVMDTSAVTEIQWEQASGADSFNFVLTRTTDSTTVLDLTFGTEICDGSVCTIPVSPEVQALLTEGDYSWDVTASNSDNSSTSGNGPWTFTVAPMNPAPTGFACRIEAPAEVVVGDDFTATLVCDEVPAPGVYGAQLCLNASGAPITAVNPAFAPGTLFEGMNTLSLVNSVSPAQSCYGVTLTGDQMGVQGGINIASATFNASELGMINFSLGDVVLGDSNGQMLPMPQLVSSMIQVVEPTASLSGTIDPQAGPALDVTITAAGLNGTVTGGEETAGFLFDDNLPVEAITVTVDAPGHLACMTTLAVNRGENAFPETINLLAGDVDNDGDVDIADSTLIGLAFGTDGNDPQNVVDLDRNGIVNILDLIFVGRNFDRTMASCTSQTIADIAAADDRFETLTFALSATGLDAALRGSGPFTVFAPTDDAFEALPDGLLDSLVADLPALTDVLLYHVAAGAVNAETVATLSSVTTLLGADVTITVNESGIFLNDTVQVIITDIIASNGIIHVIDAVLIPPAN